MQDAVGRLGFGPAIVMLVRECMQAPLELSRLLEIKLTLARCRRPANANSSHSTMLPFALPPLRPRTSASSETTASSSESATETVLPARELAYRKTAASCVAGLC